MDTSSMLLGTRNRTWVKLKHCDEQSHTELTNTLHVVMRLYTWCNGVKKRSTVYFTWGILEGFHSGSDKS